MNSVKSFLLVTILFLAPLQARAQKVFVTAGEHDGFTRVFLDAPTGSNWTMKTDGASLKIQLTEPVTGFNLSRANERISDKRIEGFVVDAPTVLRIKLACDCNAEAVDWGQGDVVVDIRNKDSGNTDEVVVQALTENRGPTYDWVSGIARPPKRQSNRPWPEEPTLPAEYELTALGQDQPRFEPPMPDHSISMDQHLFSGHDAFLHVSAAFSEQALEIPVVTEETRDETLSKEFQDALLNQLQTAAAQGIIDLSTQSFRALDQPIFETNERMHGTETNVTVPSDSSPARPSVMQQMLVTNALDPGDENLTRKTLQSEACLPQAWFDPNSWAPMEPSSGLAGLRAALVGEFDKPDPEAVVRLANFYLYLGFGLEARQLVETFHLANKQADIVGQIARILDQKEIGTDSAIEGQIGCNPDATLWGLLVSPSRILDPDVDLSKVLAAFSDYPIHLRNLIGPSLVGSLVEFDKTDEAVAVRNLITRSEDADAESVNLITAEIELAGGNLEAASTMLGDVVAQDSTKAAEALIKLISERKAAGLSVDAEVASAADALAVEYRGTELGRQLTEAAIRAFSISGQPQITFARIHDAQKRASISDATIVTLTNEAFEDAVSNADDVVFLRLVHSETLPEVRNDEPRLFRSDRKTRISVADRLIELEFFDKAAAILEPLKLEESKAIQLRLAKIAYGTGHYQDALDLLIGRDDEAAQDIRANALFKLGDYAAASTLFDQVGAHTQAARAAWISGDFERASRMDTGPVSKLVTTSAGSPPPVESLSSLEAPLATFRRAAETAAEMRAVAQQAIN